MTSIKRWIEGSLCYWFWQPRCTGSRHSTYFFFLAGNGIKTMKTLETQSYVSGCFYGSVILCPNSRFTRRACNEWQTKTSNWRVLVTQTKLNITMNGEKLTTTGFLLEITNRYKSQTFISNTVLWSISHCIYQHGSDEVFRADRLCFVMIPLVYILSKNKRCNTSVTL